MVSLAQWCKEHPEIAADVYMCMSLQAQVGPKIGKYHRALRNAQNALYLKAIWLDIDVKAPPKGYNDINEATEAIDKFVADAGLPPTAL